MKILYVTTISNTVNAFLIPHIKMLVEEGHKIDVAFNIEQDVDPAIIEMGCKIYELPFQRSPFSKKNFNAFKKLKTIIEEEQYDVVHTHTPVASAVTRLACINKRNIKVFYTAHGFHFYKGAPLVNWLIYYPVEKLLSKHTDVLITINKEDFERAKKDFKAKKIKYIPGVGIDTKKHESVKLDKESKRKELGVYKSDFVLLSVGELNSNKNHEVIIRALSNIKNNQIQYIVCGKGPLKNDLVDLANKLKVGNQVHILGFRKDIPDIYRIADVFVFPSYREGLSVALMEAMSFSMPVICSNIRGNSDLIENNKGGYLVKANDISGFEKAIKDLLSHTNMKSDFGIINNKNVERYSIEHVLNQLKGVYASCTNT